MATLLERYVSMIDGIASITGAKASSIIDTLSVSDKHTFLVSGGACCSVFEIYGVTNKHDGPSFASYIEKVTEKLTTVMTTKGTELSFVFSYGDNSDTENEIKNSLIGARQTAKNLGLDLDFMFDEREKHIRKFISSEYCYLVVYTYPEKLQTPNENQEHRKNYKFVRNGEDKEVLGQISESLNLKHKNTVETVKTSFERREGIRMGLLTTNQVLQINRKEVTPEWSGARFPHKSVNDKEIYNMPTIPKANDIKSLDIDSVLGQSYAKFMFPKGSGKFQTLRYSQIGDYIHGPMFVDEFQIHQRSFDALFNDLKSTNLPYRLAIRLESNKVSSAMSGLKATLFQILAGFGSKESGRIGECFQNLEAYERDGGATVSLSMIVDTWVPFTEHKSILQNQAMIAQKVMLWGQTSVDVTTGDSFAASCATLVGVSSRRYNYATRTYAPLANALLLSPITRPATYWNRGPMLARTEDGKLMPLDFASDFQENWALSCFGKMGYGKSVIGQAILLAVLLREGAQRFPIMVSVDIGGSSRGFYSLIKSALPDDKKHLVETVQLSKESKKHNINPFDLPLGLKKPMSSQITFLRMFFPLLFDNEEEMQLMDTVSIGLIEELYKLSANHSTAKEYSRNIDELVDKGIDKHSISIEDTNGDVFDLKNLPENMKITWYEVRDALMKKGETYLAIRAQRYAVPTFRDIARIASREDMIKRFKSVTYNGQQLLERLSFIIKEKSDSLSLIMNPTTLDVDSALMISVDIERVINKQTATTGARNENVLMYLSVIFLFQRIAELDEESIELFDKIYQSHQRDILEIVEDAYKVIQLDEWKEGSSYQILAKYVEMLTLRGRKHRIIPNILSQKLSHFNSPSPDGDPKKSTDLFSLSATKIIMGATDEDIDNIYESYKGKYSDHTIRTMRDFPTPSGKGAFFNAGFDSKEGFVNQNLVLTLSPAELWCFEFTHLNLRIKRNIINELGVKEGIMRLVKYFPEGTCAKFVKDVNNHRTENAHLMTEEEELEAQNLITDEITREVIADTFRKEHFIPSMYAK